ncbi:MAG: Endopeptidase La [Actinobacteria bacterium]|nr:Endopeptidase La [Actinomycetota bacterium]
MRFSPLPRFATAILGTFFALALVAPLPFVIVMPGSAQNIFEKIITIKNQQSYEATGRLDLMSVRVTNPTNWIIGPEVLYAWFRSDEAVYPRAAIYPPGATTESEKKAADADMVSSQSKAIGAGLNFLSRHPEFGVPSDQLIEENINFDVKRTGGPSGGMIFALGVIELLTPIDILDSRHISGSGTITIDGKVGPIGGINEKIQAAYKAGATLFLAPIGNRDEITNVPKGVKVVIVATLDDAMKAITAKG